MEEKCRLAVAGVGRFGGVSEMGVLEIFKNQGNMGIYIIVIHPSESKTNPSVRGGCLYLHVMFQLRKRH